MQFRLLGPLEASTAGRQIPLGGPKQRALLVHLVLRANQLVPAERLIDEIWGDDPPRTVRSSLQRYVSQLRSALGDGRLEGRERGYVLHVEPSEIDALQFEMLLEEARRRTRANPVAAGRLYSEALALWRGAALDDVPDHVALAPVVARWDELRAAAVDEWIALQLGLGRHRELIPELERLTATHPLSEQLCGHLMVALYRSGRQADALAAFQRARHILGGELGVDPSPQLRLLHQQILRQDAVLDAGGELIRGYRLLERLGDGAFGAVHRALHRQVSRDVALRVVHPALAADPGFIRCFETLAQQVARLEHPHIVPLYDWWRDPDGAYLVMRLMRGGSLRDRLHEGPVDPVDAVRVVEQIGAALAFAHRQGVLHRDVRPENVLFDDDGNAYLTDFAFAVDLADVSRSARTGLPHRHGVPGQRVAEQATTASDVLGFGALARELVGDASPDVVAVLGRAMAVEPSARHPDAGSFAHEFAAAAAARPGRRPVPVPTVRNPYKGLRAFGEADADDFFGRQELLARLVRALATTRLLAVVGPSGSGKSSVVRAGLVPALRRGALPGSRRWYVVEMLPGPQPFSELEIALLGVAPTTLPPHLAAQLAHDAGGLARAAGWVLPDDDSELVVVIDQFEELFTLVSDEGLRAAFLAALVDAATDPGSRVRIVLSLRADFYDRPLRYPDVAALFADHTEVVPPLTGEELEHAITGPAGQVGVTVDPVLVAHMISDVADQPGGLPLVQYALTELFDRRADGHLTNAAYGRIGGISGALASRAEQVYGSLPEKAHEATRQLFLRLVTLTAGVGDTRRRVLRAELDSLQGTAADIDAVVAAFAAARLLSLDRDPDTRGPTVEVAHEALLREWGRVRGWIEAAREDLAVERRLAAAVDEWDGYDRDPSFLLSGGRLAQLEDWRGRSGLATTSAEREYLEASLAERDRVGAVETARASRERSLERRSVRRLRGLVAVLAVLGLVTSTLTVVAVGQRQRAENAVRDTQARRLATAATSVLAEDPERSILLALEAVGVSRRAGEQPLPEAVAALHQASQSSRLVHRIEGGNYLVDVSADGQMVATDQFDEATAGLGNGVIVWDAATGQRLRELRFDTQVRAFRFSSRPGLLAVALKAEDGASMVELWDTGTWQPVRRLSTPAVPEGGMDVAWSPTARRLVVVSRQHITDGPVTITTWDVTGEALTSIDIQGGGYRMGEFLDEGTFVMPVTTRTPEGKVQDALHFYDVTTGDVIRSVATPDTAVQFVMVDRDDGTAALGTDDGLEVRSLETGELVWRAPSEPLRGVRLVGDAVASSHVDGTVQVRDMRTGTVRAVLAGHAAPAWTIADFPGGHRLASVAGGETRIWDVTPAGPRALGAVDVMPGDDLDRGDPSSVVWDIQMSSRERTISVFADRRLDRYDLVTGEEQPGGLVAGNAPATTPDLSRAAFLDESGRAWLRDLDSGTSTELPPCSEPKALNHDASAVLVQIAGGPGDRGCVGTGIGVGPGRGSRAIDVVTHAELVDVGVRDIAGPWGSAFNPGGALPAGRYLALIVHDAGGSMAAAVKIYDVVTGRLVAELSFPGEDLEVIEFDPTGRYLAGATSSGRAWVLDLAEVVDGREVGESLVFDRVVANGKVDQVALNVDGVLATSAFDQSVRLWDSDTGRLLVTLPVSAEVAVPVAFSPDGDDLYYADAGYLVRRFPLDADELVMLAESRLTRDLTDEECRQYLPEECPEPGGSAPSTGRPSR